MSFTYTETGMHVIKSRHTTTKRGISAVLNPGKGTTDKEFKEQEK